MVYLNHNGLVFDSTSKKFLTSQGVPDDVIEEHLINVARQKAITRIERACTHHIENKIFIDYPKIETETFSEQVSLAMDYLASPSADSAIHKLAESSGVDVTSTATKIANNAKAARPKVMSAIGYKQAKVRQILALATTDVKKFNEIKWGEI